MKIVVLGAGMMGRAVVYDLARAADVSNLIVADFDRGRAEEVAGNFGRGKANAAFADVRETAKLARILRGSTSVVNCTQYNWNLEVMKAALRARVNYLDFGGLYHMTRKQFALDAEFRRIGRIAIAGMGGAPGTYEYHGAFSCRLDGSRGLDCRVQCIDGFAALQQPHRLHVFDCDDSG